MNNVPFQPGRMKTVNPYLLVEKIPELIGFVETVFGGSVKLILHRPGGSIMHVELLIGDSVIMAGEPIGEYGPFPASLFIYVPDCDKVYEKAINSGAVSIMIPTTMVFAGERYGGVKDSNGNIWWIATHIEDLTQEEQIKRIKQMKENWASK